jgi:Cytochrome c oxidase subunit IV
VKIGAGLFLGGAPLFIAFAVAYGIVSGWDEQVGLAGLFLVAALAALIGAYLWYTADHVDALPEDNPYGEIAEGAGELGEFAPYSWWPLAAAGGGAILFAGMAIGVWLMLLGALVGLIGLIGWVFEFYRGEHAH